jgi:hypothetical protein
MIIDTSYFQSKEVFIPNAIAQPSIGSNTPTSISQLQQEIDSREYDLLLLFLGQEQTDELLSQFETDGTWKTSALQKWKDLVDGVDNWRGLRYTVGTKKVSIIAFYVFFYYLKEDFSTYSTTGINVAKSENAQSQLPNEKQVSAWNSFVKMYQGDSFNRLNYSVSSNWNGTMLRWSGQNGNAVSLYEFMFKNSDVYDTSFFINQSVINTYNL